MRSLLCFHGNTPQQQCLHGAGAIRKKICRSLFWHVVNWDKNNFRLILWQAREKRGIIFGIFLWQSNAAHKLKWLENKLPQIKEGFVFCQKITIFFCACHQCRSLFPCHGHGSFELQVSLSCSSQFQRVSVQPNQKQRLFPSLARFRACLLHSQWEVWTPFPTASFLLLQKTIHLNLKQSSGVLYICTNVIFPHQFVHFSRITRNVGEHFFCKIILQK